MAADVNDMQGFAPGGQLRAVDRQRMRKRVGEASGTTLRAALAIRRDMFEED
ncbi:MAG: hypothetical protein KGK11_06565 [Sphingomonadales bacterium]|nr:hypothetical protein [Sphingomonadales bacterium]